MIDINKINERLLISAREFHNNRPIELINLGADVNTKDEFGQSPIHFSVKMADEILTLKLISKGANVNLKDNCGDTPLYPSIHSNSFKNTAALISNGANVNSLNKRMETPLHSAAVNSAKALSLLISEGANVNAKDMDGDTPLHWAAISRDKEIILKLISAGANVQEENLKLEKPLKWAEKYTRINNALVFIAYGSNAYDLNGNLAQLRSTTPRQAAAQMGLTDRMMVLLRDHPSKAPGDEPEALATLAQQHDWPDTVAAIQSFMAAKAVESVMRREGVHAAP